MVQIVRTGVHAEIVDGVATTTIDQVFRNDGGRDAEGTWFLSLPDTDPRADRPTFGFVVNVGLALVAAAVALAGIATDRHALWALSLPVELAGGVAFAAAGAFEGGPQRFVRAVWRWQIAGLAVAGAAIGWHGSLALGLGSWVLLAAPFVAGLYGFEALDRRWWRRAAL